MRSKWLIGWIIVFSVFLCGCDTDEEMQAQYDLGYSEGQKAGYDEGYHIGYDDGFADGEDRAVGQGDGSFCPGLYEYK